MSSAGVKRNIVQRILGIPATRPPADGGCWTYANGEIVVDLSRAPELSGLGSGVRIESDDLPERVLLVHGVDGTYRAYRNRCGHGGRRVDPCSGEPNVQCCSVGKATYDYSGTIIEGPAKEPLVVYPVEVDGAKLKVLLQR
jgi:nitrite reductase/ring-hydroxylating ferredoxin subunit